MSHRTSRTSTVPTWLLLAGLLHALAVGAAAQDTLSTQIYDVRCLVTMSVELADPFAPADESNPEEQGPFPIVRLELGDLHSIVKHATGLDYWEIEGVGITPEDTGFLTVTCGPKMHRMVARTLDLLRAQALEQVGIEVHTLPGRAIEGGRTILSAQECDALLRSIGDHPIAVGTTRFDEHLLLSSLASSRQVTGTRMQVAESGAILPDPTTEKALAGASWRIRLKRAHGDSLRVIVEATSRKHESTATRPIPSGSSGQVTHLQLPAYREVSMRAEATIASGQALLIGCQTEHGGALCIRAKRLQAPLPAPVEIPDLTAKDGENAPTFAAFSISDLVNPGDSYLPPVMDEARLEELVTSSIHPDEWGIVASCHFLCGHLFVRAERKVIHKVSDLLDRLRQQLGHQYAFELRYGPIGDRQLPTALSDPGSLQLPNRCLSVLSLNDARLHVTRTSTVIQDYDPVRTREAVAATPITDTVVEGLQLLAQRTPIDDRRSLLRLQFFLSERIDDGKPFDLGDPRFGSLDQPVLRNNAIRGQLIVVEHDRWQLVETAPIEGTDRHLAVIVRLRQVD